MDELTRSRLNRSLAALADGDRGAFDSVYRLLWPALVRFAAALTRDRMVAEDMAQQAMLKILARAPTFDRSKDALTWSMKIAANECCSYRRKRGNWRMDPSERGADEPIDEETPERIAIRDNLREAARDVMSDLRPQELDAVVTAFYEAERPPVAAATFRKRLQRALAHARLLWTSRHDDGTG